MKYDTETDTVNNKNRLCEVATIERSKEYNFNITVEILSISRDIYLALRILSSEKHTDR